MLTTRVCVVPVCDGCGTPLECDDYKPHFRTSAEAFEQLREFEWTIVGGDERAIVFCDNPLCGPVCECEECDHPSCPLGFDACLCCPAHNHAAARAYAETERARRAAKAVADV